MDANASTEIAFFMLLSLRIDILRTSLAYDGRFVPRYTMEFSMGAGHLPQNLKIKNVTFTYKSTNSYDKCTTALVFACNT